MSMTFERTPYGRKFISILSNIIWPHEGQALIVDGEYQISIGDSIESCVSMNGVFKEISKEGRLLFHISDLGHAYLEERRYKEADEKLMVRNKDNGEVLLEVPFTNIRTEAEIVGREHLHSLLYSPEQEFEAVVADLNYHLFSIDENNHLVFSYEGTENFSYIKFGDEILWCSEEDEREFFEEDNRYEPLLDFVKKKFNEYVKKLQKFRFEKIEPWISLDDELLPDGDIPREVKTSFGRILGPNDPPQLLSGEVIVRWRRMPFRSKKNQPKKNGV